jgi:hypothetical protein
LRVSPEVAEVLVDDGSRLVAVTLSNLDVGDFKQVW